MVPSGFVLFVLIHIAFPASVSQFSFLAYLALKVSQGGEHVEHTVVKHSILGLHAFQVQVDPLETSVPESAWAFPGCYLSPKRSTGSAATKLYANLRVGKLALVAHGTPLAQEILPKHQVDTTHS